MAPDLLVHIDSKRLQALMHQFTRAIVLGFLGLAACSRSGGVDERFEDTGTFDTDRDPYEVDVLPRTELLVTPLTVDFGNLTPFEEVCRDVVVSNIGNQTVTVGGVETEGDGFAISMRPTVLPTLAPTDVMPLTVCARPLDEGSFEGRLVIYGEDRQELAASVLFVASHAPDEPCLTIAPQEIWFEPAVVGSFSQQTVEVRNCSRRAEITLREILVSGGDGAISTERTPLPLILEVGDGLPYTVTFSPEEERSYGATVIFRTDDLDATLQVSGEAFYAD